jgi:hypothetical protein
MSIPARRALPTDVQQATLLPVPPWRPRLPGWQPLGADQLDAVHGTNRVVGC